MRITGGSSMAAMIFKVPPQFGQRSMAISSEPLTAYLLAVLFGFNAREVRPC